MNAYIVKKINFVFVCFFFLRGHGNNSRHLIGSLRSQNFSLSAHVHGHVLLDVSVCRKVNNYKSDLRQREMERGGKERERGEKINRSLTSFGSVRVVKNCHF